MTPEEADNALRSIAKKLITEFRSKDNESTYRQLLDKHAKDIAPFCPQRHEPWLYLNVICQQVASMK